MGGKDGASLWASPARVEGAGGPPGRQPGDAGDGMVATHLCVPLPGEDDRKGWRAGLR